MKAWLATILIALPTMVLAHPHEEDAPKKETPKTEMETDTDTATAETKSRTIIRLKRDDNGEETERVFTWNSDDMEAKARDFADLMADSDVAASMTEILEELKGSIEIDTDSEGATAFFFDGEEMLRFKRDQEVDSDDRLSISGLGRNLTVERKTTKKDGKTRTRIVIEMDGGEDVDIDLPEREAE